MADNFRGMVLDAPPKALTTLSLRFCNALPIKPFLERMDIPKLFSRVSYWQGSKISFTTTGTDKRNCFVDQEIYIYVTFLQCKLEDVTELILKDYEENIKYEYDEPPLIVSMNIRYL